MIIGLTGGIGSGKSFVASVFKGLGAPVYTSDIKAKELMHTNEFLKNEIINLLGEAAYLKGKLNRDWIAQQVFSDKTKLNSLNALVHPVVAIDFMKWYKEQSFPFVIQESAILFESGGHKKCDKIVLVSAPESIRVKRVIDRDDTTEEAVMKRINNQNSDLERIPLSDFIIKNINRKKTILQVRKVFETLMKQV